MDREGVYKQVWNFVRGMGSDLDNEKQLASRYREAMNYLLTQDGSVLSLAKAAGEEVINHSLPFGQQWERLFTVRATYGATKEVRDSVAAFSTNPSTGVGMIWILDTTTDKVHKIYDDLLQSRPDRPYNLQLGREIDAYSIQDGSDFFLYWVDDTNPIRYIRLHVANPAIEDNSTAPNSPLFVANEPDCLWLQRLWPEDQLTIASVNQTGGAVLSATYQFSYRYWNSVTRRYSAWQLLTNPFTVIDDDYVANHSNNIAGSPPLSRTSKSINLSVNKIGQHSKLYNAIQLAVVRHAANVVGSVAIEILRPSQAFYGAPGVSMYTYTGNEEVIAYSEDDLTVDDAQIFTARIIEEDEGRMWLANITYWDLSFSDSAPTASTTTQAIQVNVDPLSPSNLSTRRGYSDPFNGHLYRGYFREEVYRFGRTYVNKFGMWGKPRVFDFSATKYNPADHAATWQRSWSESGNIDWKFADRQSSEGSLFNTSTESLKAYGLSLAGVNNHPSWAYGLAIVRLPRKKNILGQSPVINGVGIMGGSNWKGDGVPIAGLGGNLSYLYYENKSGIFDYDGSLDTYEPKMLSRGMAKNLSVYRIQSSTGTGRRFQYHKMGWTLQGHKIPGSPNATYATSVIQNTGTPGTTFNKEYCGLLFLYPLEYLANINNEAALDAFRVDGTEAIKIVDAVAMVGLNTFRDNTLYEGSENPSTFNEGRQSKYAWVFAPAGRNHYYYYTGNNHAPGELLNPSGTNPIVQSASEVQTVGGWKMVVDAKFIPIDTPVSRHEHFQHIKTIGGLERLAVEQTKNTDELWKNSKMNQAYAVPNQAALVMQISADEGLDTSNVIQAIYDPTKYIYDRYVLTSTLANLFNISETIDAIAIGEDLNSPTQAEDDVSDTLNRVIPNTTMVPIYIANITAGLGDNRYGPKEQSLGFIFTGAYTPITGADASGNVAKSFSVFGGDCYITRLIACIRTNAPMRSRALIEENNDRLAVELSPGTNITIKHADKASTYTEYAEWIDLWVESEVNGHYLIRPKDQYPRDFDVRPTSGLNTTSTPIYSKPDTGMAAYNSPALYQYDFGTSAQNSLKQWIGFNPSDIELFKFPQRVVYSNVKVAQNLDSAYDKFLVLNYYDLSGASGEITAILRSSTNKHIVVQEDGIAMIYVGRSLIEDPSGNTIVLGTGTVVGYATYLSDNHKSGGDIGGQFTRSSVRTGGGVFVFDAKRGKVVIVGDGLNDVTVGEVEAFINKYMGSPYERVPRGGLVTMYDNINRRVIIHRNPNSGAMVSSIGLVYNQGLGIWEGGLDIGQNRLKDLAASGQDVYAAVNYFSINSPAVGSKLSKLYRGAGNAFLGEKKSSLLLIANNEIHAASRKIVSSLSIHASAYPGRVKLLAEDAYGVVLETEYVDSSSRRGNVWIYNQFKDRVSGGRIRGENISIFVENLDPDPKLVVKSAELLYRLDPEQ